MESKGVKEAKVKQPRAKKGAVVVPIADSVVSAFGGAIEPKVETKETKEPKEPNPAIFIEEVEQPIVPTPKSKKSSKRKSPKTASPKRK